MTIPARNAAIARRFAWIAAAGTAACILAAPVRAQETGVSHPDTSVITADPDTPAVAPSSAAKPSAAISAKPADEVFGPFVPYHVPGTPAPVVTISQPAFDPDGNIVTAETAGRADRQMLNTSNGSLDPDAGIVTSIPSHPGEISEGALIKARLQQTISTVDTVAGTKFSATITEPLMKDGKVIVPSGSLLEGKVTYVRGGKRLSGGAAIHMEPRTISLPDGTKYIIEARLIDTDNWNNTKIDSEGTVLKKENGKQTLATMSLAAGGPMAAGAVIGGVPGALIGAGVGAGVGTVIWLKQDRQAELPKDLGVVFSLTEPMSITPIAAAATTAVPATAPTGGY